VSAIQLPQAAPVIEVPGFGLWPVLKIYSPNEQLPEGEARYLITENGAAYQVPFDAKEVEP